MKFSLSRRPLPRRRLLVAAFAFIATGTLLTIPANALENSASNTTATNVAPLLVGIGDSFTSGVGNTPYTDASQQSGCDRSARAYPTLAAASIDMRGRNYACSGATTEAFTAPFKGEPAQVDRLDGADAVVFTIGGNDAGLIDAARTGDLAAVEESLSTLPAKLQDAYNAVGAAAPDAYIFAVTYPDIFPTTETEWQACASGVLQQVPVSRLHAVIAALNSAITKAAQAVEINLIDASGAFEGHDICSQTPWVYGPSNPEGLLHPNVAGQRAMAAVVADAVGECVCSTTTTTTRPTTTTKKSTTTTTRPTTTTTRPTTTTTRPTTTTTRPTTTTTEVIPEECECDTTTTTRRPTTTSTTRPTTTTTRPTTTTTLVEEEAPVEYVPEEDCYCDTTTTTTRKVRPVAMTSSSTTSSTTSSTSSTTTSSTSTSTSTTTQPAEVEGETVERDDTLAYTGARVMNTAAIGIALLGAGFLMVWLRYWVRERSDVIR